MGIGMRRAQARLFLAIIAICFASLAARAGERVNMDESNIAILGYDAVAYFTVGEPTPGSPQFEHVWHEARWQFASADHRDMFASDPDRFAPRYGGFCAGAMALGWRAPIDPEAWVIIDERLYLAFADDAIDEFAANADERIAVADENWQELGQTD